MSGYEWYDYAAWWVGTVVIGVFAVSVLLTLALTLWYFLAGGHRKK